MFSFISTDTSLEAKPNTLLDSVYQAHENHVRFGLLRHFLKSRRNGV